MATKHRKTIQECSFVRVTQHHPAFGGMPGDLLCLYEDGVHLVRSVDPALIHALREYGDASLQPLDDDLEPIGVAPRPGRRRGREGHLTLLRNEGAVPS